MSIDAEAAALEAVEIAARQIRRLKDLEELSGFDGMDLDRYAKICLAYEHHRLTWMSKLDPEKLSDELLKKYVTGEVGEPNGKRPKRAAG